MTPKQRQRLHLNKDTEMIPTYSHRDNTDLSFVVTLAGETSQQQLEESGQNLSQRLGCVGDHHLPHMQRRLADVQCGVGAAHVETGEHAVTSLAAEYSQYGLLG